VTDRDLLNPLLNTESKIEVEEVDYDQTSMLIVAEKKSSSSSIGAEGNTGRNTSSIYTI